MQRKTKFKLGSVFWIVGKAKSRNTTHSSNCLCKGTGMVVIDDSRPFTGEAGSIYKVSCPVLYKHQIAAEACLVRAVYACLEQDAHGLYEEAEPLYDLCLLNKAVCSYLAGQITAAKLFTSEEKALAFGRAADPKDLDWIKYRTW